MNGTALLVMPSPSCSALLPGHDFVDAYQVQAGMPGLDARQAAEAVLRNPPAWIKRLVSTRNRVVRLFQLKTVEIGVDDAGAPQPTIGGFPVVAQSPQEVVLGFDEIGRAHV